MTSTQQPTTADVMAGAERARARAAAAGEYVQPTMTEPREQGDTEHASGSREQVTISGSPHDGYRVIGVSSGRVVYGGLATSDNAHEVARLVNDGGDLTTDAIDLGHGVVAVLDTDEESSRFFPGTRRWWAPFGNDDAVFIHEETDGPAEMRFHVMPWAGWSCGGRAGHSSFVSSRERAVQVAARFVARRLT